MSGWLAWAWVIAVDLAIVVAAAFATYDRHALASLRPQHVAAATIVALVAALLATIAWLWLVQWRAGRNRHPLWKSMVLPAGGVALCWLLAMTLWLPLLDYGRSYRPMVQRIARHIPAEACVAAPGAPRLIQPRDERRVHHGAVGTHLPDERQAFDPAGPFLEDL